MNDFSQVEEYLTKKCKECCDEIDNFLMLEIINYDPAQKIRDGHMNNFYHSVYKNIESRFNQICESLRLVNKNNETFTEIVTSQYQICLLKIKDSILFKQMLMQMKVEKHQAHVNRQILLDWLSGNKVDSLQKVMGEEKYCFCRGVSYGKMIGCDGPNCKLAWFHYNCVGIKDAPPNEEKWFCAECKQSLIPNRA